MPTHLLRRVALILSATASLLLASPLDAQNPTAPAASGQETAKPLTEAIGDATVIAKPSLEERLRTNLEVYERQQQELNALLKRRNELGAGKADPELDKAIESERKHLKDLRQQFIELATSDYNLLENNEPPAIEIKWQEEMLQVVYPLLREMKQLSERPRLIENLSTEIAFYSQRVVDLDEGLTHLREVMAQTQDPKLLPPLKKLEKSTTEALEETRHRLDSLQHRYDGLRNDSPPLWSSFTETAREFTTGMGWHFLIAATLASAMYFLIVGLARLPLPALERRQLHSYVFVERAVHFFSRIFASFVAILIFLIVLYSMNEWVLLGLTIIVIVGVLLSAKNSLPNHLTEIRTMLNLGSVRQGERLLFNGLPWRIADLDMYTLLSNPALDGLLRVPLTQISRLSSRPYHQDEPWFPTRKGDYVLMGDGTFGRIERQTPEQVQLNFGESLISYPTEQFLNAKPQNLSTGFAVGSNFGIDYRHQHTALDLIEKQLREGLEASLKQQDFAPYCVHVGAEYKLASASSLDFRLMAAFKGEGADAYWRIQRWLQRAALECANRHGWEIPFQQVTIHTAAKSGA
jgi:hypothetical protein